MTPTIQQSTRRAVLTFYNGERVQASVVIPPLHRTIFHEQLERKLARDYNTANPNALHKVVKVHLMRN